MAGVELVEIPVPLEVAQLNLFDRVDYQDAFAGQTAEPRSPEQLMRETFENAPALFLELWARVLGQAVLGLSMDRRDRSRVVGWDVLVQDSETFVIGLDTPRGLNARLIALTPPRQEIISTQIQLTSSYTRRLWPAIRFGHRRALPRLLRRSMSRTVRG